MASYVGNKKVLGGFVGTKRIVKECLYINELEEKIRNGQIPCEVWFYDETPSAFGYNTYDLNFLVTAINNASKQITIDIGFYSQKPGYPIMGTISGSFRVGLTNINFEVDEHYDDIYHNTHLTISLMNKTVSFTSNVWDTIYYTENVLKEKIIYQSIPHSWKPVSQQSYNYVFNYLSELQNAYPPCEIFANKVARTGVITAQWEIISEEEFWYYKDSLGYNWINPVSYEEPSYNDLPPAENYPNYVAVVSNIQDLYAPLFFVCSYTGVYTYYKCLPN